jgi:hypothetical protein
MNLKEKDEFFKFSIKIGNSEINLPSALFLGIIGGLFLVSIVKSLSRTM